MIFHIDLSPALKAGLAALIEGEYAPPAGTPSRVTLAPDRWAIAGANDLALRSDISSDSSKVGAQLALRRFLAANADQRGQLQVVMFEEAA